MRKTVLVAAVLAVVSPLALLAAPAGSITSLSPSQFYLGATEQFLTINGTNLAGEAATYVKFTGKGLNTSITEEVTATPTQVIVGMPAPIINQLGKYNVTVQAVDLNGHARNIGPASFTVVEPPPPPPPPPLIEVPENVVVEATGPSGAIAEYTVTVTSVVNPNLTATCSPASGSFFPLGSTTVHCSATDVNGTTTADFPVSVTDTTYPDLTVPADITTYNQVVTFTATATDIVDGNITPTCTPASGSTFDIGTTEVFCVAVDSSLNEITKSFFVTVLTDTTPPTVSSITASPNNLWPPNHEMTAVTITVVATDDLDPSPVSQITAVSSNQPINGTGDGDQAPDWQITGALTLNLRAERANTVEDRIYTITVVTSDSSGNTTTSYVTVTVHQP